MGARTPIDAVGRLVPIVRVGMVDHLASTSFHALFFNWSISYGCRLIPPDHDLYVLLAKNPICEVFVG